MQRKLAGAVVAVLALGIAGCGGGSKPLSAAQFRARVDAVCRHTQTRARVVNETKDQTPSEALGKLAESAEQEVDALDAIAPPAALQHRFAQLVAAMRTDRDHLVRGMHGWRPAADQTETEWARLHSRTRIAEALGLTVCK